MASMKQEIAGVVKQPPKDEQIQVFNFAKKLLRDDIASEADKKSIKRALKEYKQGKTIKFEDIDWG